MLEVWLPLLICIALGVAWYHALRLREHAVAHARRLCERHGLQLLDDSVALHRLRAQWRHGSLLVMREYRFDTSCGGNDRQPASLTLLDDRIVRTSLPSREPVAGISPVVTITPSPAFRRDETTGKVVPFDRGRRTLH